MGKLHEALAVEASLKGQAEKTRKELATTFDKKRHLFSEKLATYFPLDENEKQKVEEVSSLQSTVGKELEWITSILAPALDTSYAIAEGNTLARADVVLEDGSTLLTSVPATALLELEKRVNEVHELVNAIPTLDPAKGFTLDGSRGSGIYKAREETRLRTKKSMRAIVMYPATPEHPAQTQMVSEDIPAGELRTQEWSGLITPVEKADMLERVEKLRRAVKSARARANAIEVPKVQNVGKKLLNFVFGQ